MRAEFFLSYTSSDQSWAEWIAWTLEDCGLTVKLQAWDFVPGSNFVLEMQRAATDASRTIVVLSPEYITSQFGASEWAVAFAQDPEGFKRRLVPIRVRECHPTGLLSSIVYIDLAGTDEFQARGRLIQGIQGERAKPDRQPMFPGLQHSVTAKKPEFPGNDFQTSKMITPEDYTLKARLCMPGSEQKQIIEESAEGVIIHADQTNTVVTESEILHDTPGVLPNAKYEWEIVGSKPLKLGLAKLILHQPPYSNIPDSFLVQATASFGVYQEQICGLSVELALKTAWVSDRSERWQPCDNPYATATPVGQV